VLLDAMTGEGDCMYWVQAESSASNVGGRFLATGLSSVFTRGFM